jgi:hypothetical protein
VTLLLLGQKYLTKNWCKALIASCASTISELLVSIIYSQNFSIDNLKIILGAIPFMWLMGGGLFILVCMFLINAIPRNNWGQRK